MWKRAAKGVVFTFHLAGINNQNFLMRDDQTGTYWQQISGRAISGPLAGTHLELVYSDELTFGLWRKESPNGVVLEPVARYANQYAEKDWDVQMAKVKTVVNFPNSGLQSRDLILGVDAFGVRRAYPVKRILEAQLIEDRLGAQPVLILVGADHKSIRVFEAAQGEYYRTADSFMDAETGSQWAFNGCATSGKLQGTCLKPVPAIKDYWFDWRNYHHDTTIFHR